MLARSRVVRAEGDVAVAVAVDAAVLILNRPGERAGEVAGAAKHSLSKARLPMTCLSRIRYQ